MMANLFVIFLVRQPRKSIFTASVPIYNANLLISRLRVSRIYGDESNHSTILAAGLNKNDQEILIEANSSQRDAISSYDEHVKEIPSATVDSLVDLFLYISPFGSDCVNLIFLGENGIVV